MRGHCENCGSRTYSGICPNCHEELYILTFQSEDIDPPVSQEFNDAAAQQALEVAAREAPR